MAKTKKQQKAKEPVRIRFKELANGNKSIYLDVYHDGRRQYEFLKLYLVTETSIWDKQQNVETMKAANAIKAQRIIELANGAAGLKDNNKSKMLLADWLDYYYNTLTNLSISAKTLARRALDLVVEFGGRERKMCEVDKAFCAGFVDYVSNIYKKSNGQPLQKKSVLDYCNRLNFALNKAVKDGILTDNPFKKLDRSERVAVVKTKRCYLTIDEVKAMIDTDCKTNKAVKMAFLFSCFCGLRCSDIKKLKWGDIKNDGEQTKIIISQQKTKEPIYLPLSAAALNWLPAREGKTANSNVFVLPSPSSIENAVRRWAAAAGIDKHVTFHTARHTFATMMLTLGADLYTTSKLLGHTNIQTTQIYAEIIDQKKIDAVNLTNNIFK